MRILLRAVYASFIVAILVAFSISTYASDNTDYKAKYERQLSVNRGMIATDAMILTWFKQHSDYKKYPSIKSKVDYLYSELKKAKEAHEKAKAFAEKQEWKKAYEMAKEEWDHLNNIAVKGKKTQSNLKELESEK